MDKYEQLPTVEFIAKIPKPLPPTDVTVLILQSLTLQYLLKGEEIYRAALCGYLGIVPGRRRAQMEQWEQTEGCSAFQQDLNRWVS